jgi:hypothetical protein
MTGDFLAAMHGNELIEIDRHVVALVALDGIEVNAVLLGIHLRAGRHGWHVQPARQRAQSKSLRLVLRRAGHRVLVNLDQQAIRVHERL